MYHVAEDKLEAFADAFIMVQEDLLANGFNAARFAAFLCEAHALVESVREQRALNERVPKRPAQPSPLFRKSVKNA